jgi:hypothetical protein
MIPSLEPLWQTVDRLLVNNESEREEGEQSKDRGIFLLVNLCSSATPLKSVFQMAHRYGFNWKQPTYYHDEAATAEEECMIDHDTVKHFQEEVYVFQRRKKP